VSRPALLGLVCTLLIGSACASHTPPPQSAAVSEAELFRATNFVYVEFQTPSPEAENAREWARTDFARRQRFVLVNARDEADAFLITELTYQPAATQQTLPRMVGRARLVERASGRVLWERRVEPRLEEPLPTGSGVRPMLLQALVSKLSADLHRAAGH